MNEIPSLGFGTWKLPKDTAAAIVYQAIVSGVRHFDYAADYGNEIEVGKGIQQALVEKLVTREDL
jgi:D-xylose reductase